MDKIIVTILVMAIITYLTRALPFFIWGSKPCPAIIQYLGETLPYAMMALLVVYAFKSVSITTSPFGLPELIAGSLCVFLHLWKHNQLLSIGASTITYMFLVQVIF